ncbi:MAG: S41 family peptidase [Pseudomonadota bacterium]
MRKASLLLVGVVMGAAVTMMAGAPGLLSGSLANASNRDAYEQLDLFGSVFERIRAAYVDQPMDEELITGAINGMLETLDPHSGYLSETEYREMLEQTSGEFGGLGIEVTMEDGYVKVIAPIDDTPASRAGIMAGDVITHLDGESVQGLSLTDAVKLMRGEIGTDILLRVQRGNGDPLEITVVRDTIRIRSVRSELLDDVGYIRITSFSSQTETDLRRALDTLTTQADGNLSGFVLDLRNNPGGLLDQAVAVSDTFLDRGEIVSTRGREPEQIERRNARPGDELRGAKLIILINGGSASASEIVAGALQDHRRATVVGTRSFGKASVQTMIPLGGSNGALKLTTARYYTPSGTSIQAQGITPDIVIQQTVPEELQGQDVTEGEAGLPNHLSGDVEEEASGSSTYVPREREEDDQLQFALSLMRGVATHDLFPPDPERAVVPN